MLALCANGKDFGNGSVVNLDAITAKTAGHLMCSGDGMSNQGVTCATKGAVALNVVIALAYAASMAR